MAGTQCFASDGKGFGVTNGFAQDEHGVLYRDFDGF